MNELAAGWTLFSPWSWLVAAAVLAGVEILTPGAFMIWLAGAAAANAALVALIAPGWEAQLLLFVALAMNSILVGRWFGRRQPASGDPGLNRRSERLIGCRVEVVEPLVGGRGRVQVGDSPWAAVGPDLAVGATARVVRVDGTTLVVEGL